MPTRVGVFFDWQNVYEHAREAFVLKGAVGRRGTISPVMAARVLAAGHGRDPSVTSLTLAEAPGFPWEGAGAWHRLQLLQRRRPGASCTS